MGKTLRLSAFSDTITGLNIYLNIGFYDADMAVVPIVNADGTTRNTKATYVNKKSLANSTTVDIPTGTAYMRVWISIPASVEVNFDFQAYVTVDELTSSISVTEPTLVDGAPNNIITFPYQSTVTVNAPLVEYIKYMAKNAKGDKATYLMPETFGAVGDGYIDDSEAIALCLAAAAETKQTVLMAKKYLVTTPIVISDDGLNIIANDIVYNGTDTAIKINGSSNNLNIHSIVSSGIGISFAGGDVAKSVVYNNIDINTIQAASHGIAFICNPISIWQNTIKFCLIKAGGTGCYGIAYLNDREEDCFITENNFYGGHISNCEWAVYKVAGNSKCYGIQIESNVQGGFYINRGAITVFHPRIAEAQRDGTLPIYKLTAAQHTTIYDSSGIYINQIDLSEMPDIFTAASGVEFPMFENTIGVINGKILCSNLEDGRNNNTSNIYSYKTYIWNKHLIMTPFMAYRKVVTTSTLDTRLIGTETNDDEIRALPQLPTKFVVDNVNSDIYLHPSYCAFGFDQFEVEQANGFTCKVYAFVKVKNDEGVWEDSTLLIFDGSEHGDGLYKFNAYKDSAKTFEDYGALWADRSNQYWEVTKSGDTVV